MPCVPAALSGDGEDLDMYLKRRGCLSEREARCIMHQVFTALKYLNKEDPAKEKRRVIHYDIKPANILFHQGEVDAQPQ